MKHKKITDWETPSSGYKYIFDKMEVGEVASFPVKKGERERKFHACRTRCAQVSKDTGKQFKAYADDHSVYYQRLS